VPVLVIIASVPGNPVVTVPTLTVAALPLSPRGIVKLNTAAELSPELLITTSDPGSPVVTLPTAIVAASPLGPCASAQLALPLPSVVKNFPTCPV
jgi:hypothetical protein